MKSREKRIKSGRTLEVELYPVDTTGRRRDFKHKLSSSAQAELNRKNSNKHLQRLLDTNFDENDYYCTFTYKDEQLPQDYKGVKRDVNNFLRRIRRARKKLNLAELKYVYIIEVIGRKRKHNNYHIHIVLSGGLDRQTIKTLWGKGNINKIDELQPNENGLESLSKYFSKQFKDENAPKGFHKYTPSRNLKQPEIKVIENPKIAHTRSGIERIARERVDDKEYWARKYKGYRFVSCKPVYNEFNGWWYIYVRMQRQEEFKPSDKRSVLGYDKRRNRSTNTARAL
jgi:hypothetical protein